MASRTLVFGRAMRLPNIDIEDELDFLPGVNIIVGQPNAGKTQWLSMLDYLLGDRDSPEKAFDATLAKRYEQLQALVRIDSAEHVIARRWRAKGVRTKIFIDNDAFAPKDFSDHLLNLLHIPQVRFPKGNPTIASNWVPLGWRTLLRHIHRGQYSWGSLMEKMPDSELVASLLQIMGLAERAYSGDSEQLKLKQEELAALMSRKETYLYTVNEVAKQLLEEQPTGDITEEVIDAGITYWQNRREELEGRRISILEELQESAIEAARKADPRSNPNEYEQLSSRWVSLQQELDQSRIDLASFESRFQEMLNYRTSLNSELARLRRAQAAGEAFSDLKVTICPVCDQSVSGRERNGDTCFLCGQAWDESPLDQDAAEQRIVYEIKQLGNEIEEADRIVEQLRRDIENSQIQTRKIEDEIARAESQLRPVRQAIAVVMPPEMGVLDRELGRAEEKIQQLRRLKGIYAHYAELAVEIDKLEYEIQGLRGRLLEDETQINYEQAGDDLAAGMNEYLTLLPLTNGKKTWTQGRVSVRLRKSEVEFKVGGNPWENALGGTMRLYFFMAYHYSLFKLTNRPECHYPGLVILDLPARFGDESVSDKESLIAHPFIQLTTTPGYENTQVIIAGHSFENLEGVNRIELNKIWASS